MMQSGSHAGEPAEAAEAQRRKMVAKGASGISQVANHPNDEDLSLGTPESRPGALWIWVLEGGCANSHRFLAWRTAQFSGAVLVSRQACTRSGKRDLPWKPISGH